MDIQQELEKLEAMILDSPRLFNRTLVNEEQLLEQLEHIQLHLPGAFEEAKRIVMEKEGLLREAEEFAEEIIETAKQTATRMVDEMGLIQQAEAEMKQLRQRTQRECEQAQEQTLVEIERLRRQAQQDIEEMRQRALAECAEIQSGADLYADRVLGDMEKQLSDMMRVIRNGRQRLHAEAPATSSPPPRSSAPSSPSRHPGEKR